MADKNLSTYGFRIYIYSKQKNRGLIREGVIAFLDKRGTQKGQEHFNYLDEIPAKIRKKLQQLEKQEKSE